MTLRTRGFTLIELLVVIAIIAILVAILFPVFAQARERARGSACLSNVRQMGLGAVMYAQDYDEIYPGMWQWSPCAIQSHSPYLYPPGWNMARAEQECQTCPYVKNAQVFSCPTRQNPCSYGYAYPTMWGRAQRIPNSAESFPEGPAVAEFTAPASTIMITDSGIFPGTPACRASTYEGIYSLCGPRTGYSYPYVYEPLASHWSSPLPLHQGFANTAFVDGHVKPMKLEVMRTPIRMFNRTQ